MPAVHNIIISNINLDVCRKSKNTNYEKETVDLVQDSTYKCDVRIQLEFRDVEFL